MADLSRIKSQTARLAVSVAGVEADVASQKLRIEALEAEKGQVQAEIDAAADTLEPLVVKLEAVDASVAPLPPPEPPQ